MAQDSGITHFHHTAWTVRDGAPGDIWAMAQGKDGYLWLGTGTGLYRFDGVRFERLAFPSGASLPSNNITALKWLPDGSLWIGFYYGGASVLRNGRLVHYGQHEGFPGGWVLTFAQDQDGRLWAATAGGLVRFADGRWTRVGRDWNYPAERADWLVVDPAGTLWVTTGKGLVFLRKGSRRFERTDEVVDDNAVIGCAPDGTLWLSDGLHGTRALPGLSVDHPRVERDKPLPASHFARVKRFLFDRAGYLWGTDANDGGVYRTRALSRVSDGQPLRPSDLAEVFRQKQGLTSDVAVPLLEDAEGDVWVGTNLGLNSFRRNNVAVLPGIVVSPASHYGLTVDRHGVVWVANNGSLFRVGAKGPVLVGDKLPDITDVYAAPDDVLWLNGKSGLWRFVRGKLAEVTLPMAEAVGDIQSLTTDGSGGLWIAVINKGVYRWNGKDWSRWNADPDLSRLTPTAMSTDATGRAWFGYAGNRVAWLDGASVRTFSTGDGLRVGNVTTIEANAPEVLVGGEAGLARFSHGRFQSLGAPNLDALSGISGIVQSRNGDVWLNTSRGVVRIVAAELRKAFADPSYRFAYKLFDYHDGLPGIALQGTAVPSAVADAGAKLWFATNQGIAWVDPMHIHSNRVPPPVAIRSLSANGRQYRPVTGLLLPKRTSNVRLDYTAASLSNPGRVSFRYRLDGVDDQWQEAGGRREAFYTNLGPGAYRFRVIAANDDGVWNEQGAVLDFRIPPLFYQTAWFRLLATAAGLMAVALLFLQQVRQVAIRVDERLKERHAERERIARELHDTLLQSVQGLVLRFQAVAERIPPGSPTRNMIDQALDRADDVMVEGRDRVRGLRTTLETIRDLPHAFALVGEELAQDGSTDFRVVVEGGARQLDPVIREEIYCIGREALINAFQHAGAGTIEVEINYDADQLRLRIRDNGRGIDSKILESGGRPGHWGMCGMRERAQRLGAQLDIWGRPGSGTEVDLQVPAAVAYCGGNGSWLSWLRRLVSGGRYG